MKNNCILLRYGELFLKGKNRGLFIRKLIDNIKKMAGTGYVRRIQGRLIVGYFPEHHRLKRVFGLNSYSPAWKVGQDIDQIKKVALQLLKGKKGSFKIEAKRSDKTFPIQTPHLKRLLGEYIEEKNKDLEFSFAEPDIQLGIEINQDGAYLFLETIDCFGGMPAGVEGKVYLLLGDEASLLAGLMFLKRGCSVIPVGSGDVSLLEKYHPGKLRLQEKVTDGKIPVVVGQSFDDYRKIDVENLVFRPLIGFSEEKIKEELEKFRR